MRRNSISNIKGRACALPFYMLFLRFIVAAQHVDQFVFDHFFDRRSCGFQIASRVELSRVLSEELANRRGHSEA